MNFQYLILILNLAHSVFGADWSTDMDRETWNKRAKDVIDAQLKKKLNRNVAKNLILYLGDGMGITTVTAGRILKGQLNNRNGEEEVTIMESLDNVGFSKTYNIDAQTPDSAGTATAFLSGSKTRIGIIGLDGHAIYGDCKSSKGTEINSILDWAYKQGKSVGVVTTTRITHATPAAAYAHSASREWEGYDGKNFKKQQADDGCRDIAAQLIEDNSFIKVIFGGGRGFFLPTNVTDYSADVNGSRVDGRDLIQEWKDKMTKQKNKYKFVSNSTDFRNIDSNAFDNVLGLFAYSHMSYEIDRNDTLEPSLKEMTEKAIQILQRNKNGYFLLVEGGRIDHAHHESNAKRSLYDFVAFDEAVASGVKLTSKDDTLITVTADHSHTFSLGGYANRGNNIFGLVYSSYGNLSGNNLTYTSLTYANGPGGLKQIRTTNLTDVEVSRTNYIQESAVYLTSETHGGEDVPIYASGPMSHLFDGTVEQNYITHVMAYAACIGPYNTTECTRERGISESSSSYLRFESFYSITLVLAAFILN